jgi:hypothetical protein
MAQIHKLLRCPTPETAEYHQGRDAFGYALVVERVTSFYPRVRLACGCIVEDEFGISRVRDREECVCDETAMEVEYGYEKTPERSQGSAESGSEGK